MRDLPILFSGPMVRAILDGRKTQARRVVKGMALDWLQPGMFSPKYVAAADSLLSPYGFAGDRLWVRESWRVGKPHDNTRPRDILAPLIERGKGVTVLYEAGGWKSVGPAGRDEPIYSHDAPMPEWAGKSRPSIHLPRELARLVLDVMSVRIERLLDITEADAANEGVKRLAPGSPYWRNYVSNTMDKDVLDFTCLTARDSFRTLWDSLNAERGYGWDMNPWVWVIEFQRINSTAQP